MTKARFPAPLKWHPLTSAKRATLATVLRKCGQQLLRQIKGNAPGVLAGRDTEYLHQLRVAVRRLRVLLPLTRGLFDERRRRHLIPQLKVLASVLGPARDSDVFITHIWPKLRAVIGEGRLVEALDAEWLAQQRRNRRTLKRTLAAPRFGVLLSALERYFAEPAPRASDARYAHQNLRVAKAMLRRRVRRVRKRYRHACQSDDTRGQALHQLRIAIKKLRYDIDFLVPLMRGRLAQKVGARLAGLQDLLGRLNDVSTAVALVETALRGHRGTEATRLRQTLRAWHDGQTSSLKLEFIDAWKAWRKLDPFR